MAVTRLDQTVSVEILGVPVHDVTMDETLGIVSLYMPETRLHQIATVNPEFVICAQKDPVFHQVLNEAELCIPDGIGLIWASRWIKKPLRERVAGSDLVYKIAELAASNNWPIFLLGAGPGIAEAAAVRLKTAYPELTVAGTYAGSPKTSENEEIVKRINDSEATILFVAYGAPNQDKWISRNRQHLKTVRLAMGVGGSLDFISGKATRAPQIYQRYGMEWAYRLIKEPWRWKRMLSLPKFVVQVLLNGRNPQSQSEMESGSINDIR